MSKTTFEPVAYNPNKPLCIFGCLLTERGMQIKQEMLSWLQSKYSVRLCPPKVLLGRYSGLKVPIAA